MEFEYVDPFSGWVAKERALPLLFKTVRKHREANSFPVEDDLDFQVETQICQRNPGLCVNRDGSPLDSSCIHRGELIRWEGCETCGGVRAKIVACALHGECSEFKRDMGVRQCGLCPDRVSTLTD